MQTVFAIRAHERIRNGCTKPYYIECDDGEIYAVKFKENPQGLRVLVNEYVCAEIASILELPLASPTFIKCSEDFVKDYQERLFEHIGGKVTTGVHFGTQKVKKVYPITNADMLKVATNNQVIPEIVLFDQLICNRDRDSNGGNLLFDAAKKEIVVIDHTHVFDLGSIWTEADLLQRIGQPFTAFDSSGYVYRKLVPFVNGNKPFQTSIEKMTRLNQFNLWYIIDRIPEQWGVTINEKNALHQYILDRLKRIEQVLPVLKPMFPYWKGGMHND